MATKYKLKDGSKKEVICQALTFGFIYDLERGIIEDDTLEVIKNGTSLSEDEIRGLLSTDAREIVNIIKMETYPELYDEKGNYIGDTTSNAEEDKKKA